MNFDEIIDFSNLNKDVFDSLIDKIKHRNIIPYIGAGMSMPIYPLWSATLKKIANSIDDPECRKDIISESETHPLDAAQKLADRIGIGNVQDQLVKIFGEEKYEKASLTKGRLGLITQLFYDCPVITTNYDRLLEDVFREAHMPFEAVLTPSRVRTMKMANQQKLHVLFKVHGNITPHMNEEIVITQEQYDQNYGKNGKARKYLCNVLKNQGIFFLGCSLYQDSIVQLLKEANRDDSMMHFALIPCEKENLDDRRKELDLLGIRAIFYPSGQHEAVEVVLAELLHHIYPRNGCISTNMQEERGNELTEYNSGYNEDFYIDAYAKKAHIAGKGPTLVEAILMQQVHRKEIPGKRFIASTCNSILRCEKHYPLVIKGEPGTGKSTLLSLIYLNLSLPNGGKKFIIDLHKFQNDEVEKLKDVLEFFSNEMGTSEVVYLFVDGLNDYERLDNRLTTELRKFIHEQEKKIFFIMAVGELDENLFPPFKKSKQLRYKPSQTIRLAPISASSARFKHMIKNVLYLNGIVPKTLPKGKSDAAKQKAADYTSDIDNSIMFCKKMGGNILEYRTITLVVEGYQLYGKSFFEKKSEIFCLSILVHNLAMKWI